MATDSFLEFFKGTLSGLMKNEQYDALISTLEGPRFAVDFSQPELQALEMSAEEVRTKLAELREITRARKTIHPEEFPYTYVKEKENSLFIKTYDPFACGDSCSLSAPDPWWVFSVVKPEAEELAALRTKEKVGILQKMKAAFS